MNRNASFQLPSILTIITIFAGGSLANADTPAIVWGGNLDPQTRTYAGSFGWQFSRVGNGSPTEILVTQLGVFDIAGDGLANPHEVGLWRNTGIAGTLMASAIVPAGTEAPLIGGYRWVQITPVVIPFSLGSFAVAAQYSADDPDHLATPVPAFPGAVAPEIGFIFGRLAPGLGLNFPSGISMGADPERPGPVFWEANFQYAVVPEPSVCLLVAPALAWLFLRRRDAFNKKRT